MFLFLVLNFSGMVRLARGEVNTDSSSVRYGVYIYLRFLSVAMCVLMWRTCMFDSQVSCTAVTNACTHIAVTNARTHIAGWVHRHVQFVVWIHYFEEYFWNIRVCRVIYKYIFDFLYSERIHIVRAMLWSSMLFSCIICLSIFSSFSDIIIIIIIVMLSLLSELFLMMKIAVLIA